MKLSNSKALCFSAILGLILSACGGSPQPSITSVTVKPATASVEVGKTVTLSSEVVASGGAVTTVIWTSSDPTKATVSAGVVTGVAAGSVTITATSTADTSKKGTSTVTITAPAPTITGVAVSPASSNLTVGDNTTLTATVSGTGSFNNAVTWSSSDDSKATVSSSGLVSALAVGTVTITATSVADTSKSGSSTLTISAVAPPPPTITGVVVSPASKTLALNATQQFSATVSGTGAFDNSVTWSSSDTNIATVDSSGLVTAKAPGNSTITATSVADTSKSGSAAVSVAAGVVFNNYNNLAATVGATATSSPASVSGGTPPYTFSTVTPLPAGLSVAPNGTIVGQPTTPSLAANYTIQVKDALDVTATATINITVNAAPTLSYNQTRALTQGRAITDNFSRSQTGGTLPLTYTTDNSDLPPGVTLNSSGELSGTPTDSGNFPLIITVTDANGVTASTTNFSLEVNPPLGILNDYDSPEVLVTGQAFTSSTPKLEDGTQPYSYSATGLPAGLSINSGDGVISGTPTAVSAATNYTVVASDANGDTENLTINLTVVAAPTLSYTVTRALTQNQDIAAGNYTLNKSGTGSLDFAITSGTLPAGMDLDSGTGELSGAPTATGSFPLTVTLTDDVGSASSSFILVVNAAPGLSYTTVRAYTAGTASTGNYTPNRTGGTANFSYAISAGSLPAGLILDTATGQFTGTPTSAGSSSVTISVSDANGATATATALTVTVNAALAISYTPNSFTITAADDNSNVSNNASKTGGTGTVIFSLDSATPSISAFNTNFELNTNTGRIRTVNLPGNDPLVTGTFTATIKATDDNGATATATITITVNP